MASAWQVSDTEIYLVVNAGNREKDINHLRKHLDNFSVSPMIKFSPPAFCHS